MTDDGTAFRAESDPELGALLRAHYAATDEAAFVARVRARLAMVEGPSDWDILASWLRPGLAAAAAIALAVGLWLGREQAGRAIARAGGAPPQWYASDQPETHEVMLATFVMEER